MWLLFLLLGIGCGLMGWGIALLQGASARKQREDRLALMVHELKSPLTSADGFIELGEKILEQQAVEVPQDFSTARRLLRDSLRSVSEFLDLLTHEQKRLVLNLKLQPIDDLVHNIVQELSPIAEQRGMKIDFPLSEEKKEVLVRVDEGKFCQVIRNILDNAIKYGEKGVVRVRLEQEAERMQVMVEDEGRGLSAADQQRIFEKYYRASKTSSRPGSGLGLWLSQQFMEMMDGQIEVQSPVSQGRRARFTVSLPIHSSH